MNVCFLLGGFHQNGGIGRVTAMLANRLSEEFGMNVTALCYHDAGLPNLYPISPQVTQRFLLPEHRGMARLMLTGGVARLRRFLRKSCVDVLVACGALFFPIAVLACRGTGARCVCWEHSNPAATSDHRGQAQARRFGARRADLNVVLTRSALRAYHAAFPKAETVQIYNPVDEEALRAAGEYDADSRRIVSVGRLSYQKNFQAAVRAAAMVLPRFPGWTWDIYGQGEERDALLQMTSAAGLADRLCFCGQVDDLYRRYRQYGFMVMTSRYEGFPMALLEGAGNGLPLISFDVATGPNEIIEDGVNGYLVPESDVNALAERMARLMADRELRLSMSAASRASCGRFTLEDCCLQWRDALERVASGGRL